VGPVEAQLANCVPRKQLARRITDVAWLELPAPNGLEGEVIHVDAYGNLITNISARDLPERFQVRLRERVIASGTHYAAVSRGELIALVGSAGLLEISARGASAAEITGVTRGTTIKVERVERV